MNPTSNEPIIYITRDIERALGLPLDAPDYFIISNFSDFAKSLIKKHKDILLIKEKKMLDTWQLLQNKKVRQFANKLKKTKIIVFKNTLQIEKTCAEKNWKLLNPSAQLSNKVEEKISQIEWLSPLKKYLPKYSVKLCKKISWPRKPGMPCQPFILQFNRSHTGSGTMSIENEKQLEEIQKKFPERETRIAEYIPGPLFTNNNVVAKDKILLGNISYQITGLKPFTNLPFSTIGNDWALPHKILTKKQIQQYKKIAADVGLRLKIAGWKGLFGIDVVMQEKTGRLYLVEINCRQPASATYESQLQNEIRNKKNLPAGQAGKLKNYKLTTFEAHLMALLGMDLKKKKLIEIKDGAQVIQRNKEKTCLPARQGIRNKGRIIKALKKNNFNIIEYNNTKPNSDLLRIQSKTGIMKKHNEFNETGKKITKILKNTFKCSKCSN